MRDVIEFPGRDKDSSAKAYGRLLRDDISTDPDFYVFSPDETSSNKIDAVYDVSPRLWLRETMQWEEHLGREGQVLELLSENALAAVLVGHNLVDGRGVLVSYESFLPIITSQIDQHIKYMEQSSHVSWRSEPPAFNLMSTSTCWRQDHNGYSHQNPSIISHLLAIPSGRANCLFPVDATATVAAYSVVKNTTGVVNLTTLNKTDEPQWIDIGHANWQYENCGASVFGFASDDDPQIVVAGCGDIVTREALYAVKIVKEAIPELRIRFVGVTALSYNAIGLTDNRLSRTGFDEMFGNRPVVANFHGYPDALKQIFSAYHCDATVRGFIEKGSTTTPFDMLARNQADRYNLAIDIIQRATDLGLIAPDYLFALIEQFQAKLAENANYIRENGQDLSEITNYHW